MGQDDLPREPTFSFLLNPQKRQMGFHISHSYIYYRVEREVSSLLKWQVVKKKEGGGGAANEVYSRDGTCTEGWVMP